MEFPAWDSVTGETWKHDLPYILRDISNCTFVALDFELSGIPTHLESRRHTLQEKYTEVKEAARTYQILQIGLTIVTEDAVAGTYTVKPYNIDLSPLVDMSLRINRTFGFSSRAIQFLMQSGLDLNNSFRNGVPYLSTKEEERILEDAYQHNNGRSGTRTIAQIVLSKEDADSAAFLADVREEIEEWLGMIGPIPDYLDIPSRNATSKNERPAVTSLNRFQKRLVHQLIETEFPLLTSIGCTDFIRLVKYKKEREDRLRRDKISRLQERLSDLRGFRWIIEALTGGDLSPLGTQAFKPLVSVVEDVEDAYAYRKEIVDKLKSKNGRIPLVGHNSFLDMVYLYQCFYGSLPEKVEEFADLLHAKFPLLIDSKYIFTHECGDMNPVASLNDITKAFEKCTKPEIVMDAKHTRYQNTECPHEAGYDSLLTARNFLKQAMQLPGARSRASPKEDTAVAQTTESVSKTTLTKQDGNETHLVTSRTRFAGKNVYEALDSIDPEASMETLAAADDDDSSSSEPVLIPSFSAPVWKVYGNKLRVFGTDERVFDLSSARQ